MKRLTMAFAAGLLIAGLVAGPAFAAGPDNNQCWGQVTSQRAVAYGDVGSHASAQDTPRLGLYNTAKLLYSLNLIEEPTVWDLGSGLASLDGLDATYCP
jgi:hypothetical protein